MDDGRFTLRGSEPIFPVADVVATVRYYREVLGFREGWTWGEPPDFGGVRWGKVGAMFALQSGPDAKSAASGTRSSSRGSTPSTTSTGATAPRSARRWRRSPGACASTPSATSTGTTCGSGSGARTGRRPPGASRRRTSRSSSDCRRPRSTRGSSGRWDGPTSTTPDRAGRRPLAGARFGVVAVAGGPRGRLRDGARRRGHVRLPEGHHGPPRVAGPRGRHADRRGPARHPPPRPPTACW